MKEERKFRAMSGYLFLVLGLLVVTAMVFSFIHEIYWLGALLIAVTFLILPGLMVVNPNESMVMVLFGAYHGTIKTNGFWWAIPFYSRKKISLRARNFDSEPIKVNDKNGNPIKIGLVLVWKVENTYKAAFDVDNYEHFVLVQSDAALRKLAGLYPYDNWDGQEHEVTLRSGGEEVNEELEKEIIDRLKIAGINVIEARINYIAYAEEIAGAMLRRQQATAVVAARFKIVEGAVSMVEMALEQLSEKHIIDLDEEKKAAMVSNLMVVLCGDKDPNPIINAGTLNQ
jgi:regulator of protease activity HflC (stomatin/prohibitin superfamily)